MEEAVKERINDIIEKHGDSFLSFANGDKSEQKRISRQIKGDTSLGFSTFLSVLERYSDVSADELIYGERKAETNPQGVPYYDVDFIGGFDEMINDQTVKPDNIIAIPGYSRAQYWVNVTGHSMEPAINHGDIVALREVRVEDIQFGEIYAIVMDGFRTIKTIRKSRSKSYLRFVPTNPDYDAQEFEISRIIKVYEVLGSIKRFF